MLLAIDVYYKKELARIVGVLFNWQDLKPKEIIIENIDNVAEYIPGEFYKRELPCLLKLIKSINLEELEAIIIDGNIYVDNDLKFGLGGILWETLNRKIPIIGIAKTSFFSNKETVSEVYRGKSNKPLYVSTIDYPIENAIKNLIEMKGDYRIPSVLKELDTITKTI